MAAPPTSGLEAIRSTSEGEVLSGTEFEMTQIPNTFAAKPNPPNTMHPRPLSPSASFSRSKSKSNYKKRMKLFNRGNSNKHDEQQEQLIQHIDINAGPTLFEHATNITSAGNPTEPKLEEEEKEEKQAKPTIPAANSLSTPHRGHTTAGSRSLMHFQSHAHYLEAEDDENMQYSYWHKGIVDKLVWYQDVETLLPRTIPGQFVFALLNSIFSADLYYAFHRFDFKNGFKSEHRMDDFFKSRRLLSIQHTIPDLLPSLIWYQIIKYEPTPYSSMCYYQYVRQKDADKIYKLPVILGYLQFVLLVVVTFLFCLGIDENEKFFDFSPQVLVAANSKNVHSLLTFQPYNNAVNLICYVLIFVTTMHILCIFIVWRITWFLHYKIYDWKWRVHKYLGYRRKREMEEIEKIFPGKHNRKKREREHRNRIYYALNPQSYLSFNRNGELFISLLKWLNVIEFENNLDFLVIPKHWIILTFALHKYIAVLLYVMTILFGVNLIIFGLFFLFITSYWIHSLQLYNSDHHNVTNKANSHYNPKGGNSCCWSVKTILTALFWPGILFYFVMGYVVYILLYKYNYFAVIWLGISPFWLIVYSVLTRGYRRIYIFNGSAAFMFFFVVISWYLFRTTFDHNKSYLPAQYLFRYFTATFLVLFLFFVHLSLQFEIHRAMMFPGYSKDFKQDEIAQNKFGCDVEGAKRYTFMQYALLYFKKYVNQGFKSTFDLKRGSMRKAKADIAFSMDHVDFDGSRWYQKWYIQRPLDALKIATASFPFTHRSEN